MAKRCGMHAVGWFLIVIGALFILAALARVIAELRVAFAQSPPKAGEPRGPFQRFAIDPKDLGTLVDAIAKLPPYALTMLVGLLLIAAENA